jgi:uracil-DNA glycosylase family protein
MAPTKVVATAEPLVPSRPSLTSLREAAAGCQACPLWKTGTQTVFGEGMKKADVMLVGEQPGDKEDLEGRPFVGPAGKLLDRALAEAGIERDNAYVTNVVKHFKWEARGKRRIHKKPNMAEITACKPWLEAELDVVQPKAVVCLGSTAAQALLGRDFKVSRQRGELVDSDMAPLVTATVHPSSILRAPDDDAREQGMREFTRDLARVATELYG